MGDLQNFAAIVVGLFPSKLSLEVNLLWAKSEKRREDSGQSVGYILLDINWDMCLSLAKFVTSSRADPPRDFHLQGLATGRSLWVKVSRKKHQLKPGGRHALIWSVLVINYSWISYIIYIYIYYIHIYIYKYDNLYI